MRDGDPAPLEVTIHDLTVRGEGVGRLPDGRAVFVPWTIPGDSATVDVVQAKPRFARARGRAVTTPSPDRRPARCPLFTKCGGCQLQQMRYRAQVEWKGKRIGDALRRIGGLEVEDPPVEPSPSEWRYRNRMSFTLVRLGEGFRAGLHAAGGGGVVHIRYECLLPEEGILEVWMGLQHALGDDGGLLPPGEELRLTLRKAGEGVALVIEGGGSWDRGDELLEAVPGLVSVAHRPDGGGLRHLAGAREVADRWFGEEVPVASTAFLQVNRELGEALHLAVLKELGNPAGQRIVDAYCGVGAYGRRLARHGATVTGIELDPDAVAAARRDAPPGLQILEGRVEDHLPGAFPADRLILNPPRGGLHEAIPTLLRERPVPRIVYVSCDPATLARDLERLGPGYGVRTLRGFDLFPQTTHVETLVVLDHASASERT